MPNDQDLLRIANRIHLLLLKQLGEGIDVGRMLKHPLYARDVLLVCEAQPGSALDTLARHFRQARQARDEAAASTFGDSTGFGSTLGGPSSLLDDELPAARRARAPWFSPSRWLGR